MEGAKWCRNRNAIAESKKKILYDSLPVVSLNQYAILFMQYSTEYM